MKLQTMQEKVSRTLWAASALFIIGLTMTSCSEDEENAAAVGYLCPPAFEVDVTVENLDQTRSISIEEDIPAVSEITFKVTDTNGIVQYDKKGLWSEPLVLPVGSYTIEATYGKNGFGAPYFTGETNGKIVALDKTESSIELTLQNAMVRVTLGPLEGHFIPTELSANDNELGAYEKEKWYYVPSGKMISLKLDGTSSAGVKTSFTHDLSAKTAPSTAYDIVLEQPEGWPTISLPEQQDGAWATRLYITPATIEGNISDDNKQELVYEIIPITATSWEGATTATKKIGDYFYFDELTNGATYKVRARIGKLESVEQTVTINENLLGANVTLEHYDTDGKLAGTNAILNLGLTGILQTLKEAGLLEIGDCTLNKGNVTTRTFLSDGNITTNSEWPYLPQGALYSLTINHKLKGEGTYLSSIKSGISSPAPEFSLTLTSYSSYDKYLANETETANGMDAHTIKDIGANWTISSALISNSNYTKNFKYSKDGAALAEKTISGTSYTEADVTGQAIGKNYAVSASLTFDGVTKTASETHYITGLPYRAIPPSQADWTPHTETNRWGSSTSEVNFREETTRLIGKNGLNAYITHNGFYVPSGGTINVHIDNAYYCKSSAVKVVYTLSIGNQTIVTTECLEAIGKDYTYSQNHTIGSYEQFKINSYYGSLNANTYYYDVKSFNVTYGTR